MNILTFRLSIFGQYRKFSPTSENAVLWTQALQKAGFGFLPSIIQTPQSVMNSPLGAIPIGKSDSRMQFVSPSGDITIKLLAERIDVELTRGMTDVPEQYFNENINVAIKVICTMLTALGDVSGNRFAYYVDTLLPEPADKTFSDFYRQYNLGISLDGAPDECVEWVHRFNRRIAINVNKKAELLNSILLLESGVLPTINTQTGEQQVVRGLHLLADINTLAENTEDRFTVDDVQDFSLNAQDIFLRLLQQVKEKLSV